MSILADFLSLVRKGNELEIKALEMEGRALRAESELALWKQFYGWFCVKTKREEESNER